MGDLILGVILLIALLDGWRRGIIKILGSYGGIIIGVFLARRLTPVLLNMLLPHVEEHLGNAMVNTGNSAMLAEWFFTDTALGRLLELVIFIVLTSAITWLVRFATGAFGSIRLGKQAPSWPCAAAFSRTISGRRCVLRGS